MGGAVIHVYHERAARIRDAILALEPGRTVVGLCTPDELAVALPELDVLFAGLPPRTGWAEATRLRLLQLMGAGADGLLPSPDLPAHTVIAGARGVFATEVSEHALALVLASCRALPTLFARQAERVWRQFETGTLAGETMCVVGLGEVGRRVARAAAALDMRVLGVRKHPEPVAYVERVVGPDRLGEVLRESRWVVLALPLTAETKRLIDARALAELPERAVVVNVGRAGVVDEGALAAALASGRLGGAALDVLDDEPLPPESPWWTAPNTIVTPHVAGVGRNYVQRVIEVLLDNVARLDAGEPLAHLIDRERGY